MEYEALLAAMEHYGADRQEICLRTIGVSPEQVGENVILAPMWEPASFSDLSTAQCLTRSPHSPIQVWSVQGEKELTYIKTGVGAPLLMDVVLALGLTGCKKALLMGTAGALKPGIALGDVMIPQSSVCGNGANRYLMGADLFAGDAFAQNLWPDAQFSAQLLKIALETCGEMGVACHRGATFSVDTIFAQYAHLDTIIDLGCSAIEMESAAAFQAGELAGIAVAALLVVSDNTVAKRSLMNGMVPEDLQRIKRVKHEVVPQIVKKLF